MPQHEVVRQDGDTYDELSPEQRAKFDDYFVVRTAANARRFRDYTWRGITLVDEEALGRIFAGWTVDVGFKHVLGAHAHCGGTTRLRSRIRRRYELSERYPRATLAVIDDAGHALMHERRELLGALVSDWLARR